uniref:Uncharacterized protein n=1 Tax=Anopheles farauti TaxID=69004 RepID=A0A182QFP5_9DIPT
MPTLPGTVRARNIGGQRVSAQLNIALMDRCTAFRSNRESEHRETNQPRSARSLSSRDDDGGAVVISNPYALKDSGPTSDMTAWTSAGLQPTTGYYPYDPTLAAYGIRSRRRMEAISSRGLSSPVMMVKFATSTNWAENKKMPKFTHILRPPPSPADKERRKRMRNHIDRMKSRYVSGIFRTRFGKKLFPSVRFGPRARERSRHKTPLLHGDK